MHKFKFKKINVLFSNGIDKNDFNSGRSENTKQDSYEFKYEFKNEKIKSYNFNNLSYSNKIHLDIFYTNNKDILDNADIEDIEDLVDEIKKTQKEVNKKLKDNIDKDFLDKIKESKIDLQDIIFYNILNNYGRIIGDKIMRLDKNNKTILSIEDVLKKEENITEDSEGYEYSIKKYKHKNINSIINMFKTYEKAYKDNKEFFDGKNNTDGGDNFDGFIVSGLSQNLERGYIYDEDDIDNINKFNIEGIDPNNIFSKSYIYHEIKKIGLDKGIKIDYSKPLKKGYDIGYYDLQNFPYDIFKNCNGLKEKSLSGNELVALTMIFSGKEKQVKHIEGDNFDNFITNLAEKFNGKFEFKGGLDDFKKLVISSAFPKNKLSFIKNEEQYKAFLDMTKHNNFSDIKKLVINIKKNPVSGELDEEGKKQIDNFFYSNINIAKDNSEFVKSFNVIFEQYGLYKEKEYIGNSIKEKRINALTTIRGFESIEIDKAIGKLQNLKGIKKVNEKGFSFEEKLREIFANRNKLIEAFNEYEGDNLISFLKDYLKKQGVYDFMEDKITHKDPNNLSITMKKYQIYDNFVRNFIKVLSGNVVEDDLKKKFELVESNKDFNNFMDKFFDKKLNEAILNKKGQKPDEKDQKSNEKTQESKEEGQKPNKKAQESNKDSLGKIEKGILKEVIKDNLKVSLIEFMIDKGSYKIDKNFLQKYKEELFKKLIKDSNSIFNFNEEKVKGIFKQFIEEFPENKVFNFNKEKVNSLKKHVQKTGKFIEQLKKVRELGYVGYNEYHEKKEADNNLPQKLKEAEKNEKTREITNYKDVSASYEGSKGELDVFIKNKEDIIKIEGEGKDIKEINKSMIEDYFYKKYGINLKLKGTIDNFYSILGIGIDEKLKGKDFDNIDKFLQNFIYISWDKLPKEFKKDNEFDNLKKLYKNPERFIKNFFEKINNQTEDISSKIGIKDFKIDIGILNKNYSINYYDKYKEKTLDGNKENSILNKTKKYISMFFKN